MLTNALVNAATSSNEKAVDHLCYLPVMFQIVFKWTKDTSEWCDTQYTGNFPLHSVRTGFHQKWIKIRVRKFDSCHLQVTPYHDNQSVSMEKPF